MCDQITFTQLLARLLNLVSGEDWVRSGKKGLAKMSRPDLPS